MAGNANRLKAPSNRIAPMAYEASSSSASMAPLAAMMAETPRIEEPMASSDVSLGVNPSRLPSQVIKAMEIASSRATKTRLTPPSFKTSPNKKREPRNTMPTFSQNRSEEHTSE